MNHAIRITVWILWYTYIVIGNRHYANCDSWIVMWKSPMLYCTNFNATGWQHNREIKNFFIMHSLQASCLVPVAQKQSDKFLDSCWPITGSKTINQLNFTVQINETIKVSPQYDRHVDRHRVHIWIDMSFNKITCIQEIIDHSSWK